MTYEVRGTILKILGRQTFNSGSSKVEFVLHTDDLEHAQDLKFECWKDQADKAEQLQEGQKVEVVFSIQGNPWNGKYYVNLSAIRIHVDEADVDQSRPEMPITRPAPVDDDDNLTLDDSDNDPF